MSDEEKEEKRIEQLKKQRSKLVLKRLIKSPRFAWIENMVMPSDLVVKKREDLQ